MKTAGQQRQDWEAERAQTLGLAQGERNRMIQAWKQQWAVSHHTNWDQIRQPPEKAILKLHEKLQKVESSVLI
jgi:hypothetical protein